MLGPVRNYCECGNGVVITLWEQFVFCCIRLASHPVKTASWPNDLPIEYFFAGSAKKKYINYDLQKSEPVGCTIKNANNHMKILWPQPPSPPPPKTYRTLLCMLCKETHNCIHIYSSQNQVVVIALCQMQTITWKSNAPSPKRNCCLLLF